MMEITWLASLAALALASHTIYRQWQRARLERRWRDIIAQHVRLAEEDMT